MKGKTLFSNYKAPMVVALIVAFLNLIIGCSKGNEPAQDISGKTPEVLIAETGLSDSLVEIRLNSDTVYESETGLTVPSVAGPGILGGTITESYFIECANGAINEYRFEISPTNFAATVYDETGITLGSIKVYGTESDAHLDYWTPDDFVSIGVTEGYSGFTFHITDDVGTECVSFQNEAEIDQTSALLNQVQDEGTPEYSSYEQELMEKGNFWINAIESKTAFIDGELSTALELLSSNSVFDDLGDNPSLPATWHCGRACICAIAGIIAHSCFAVPWCVACWVICVPAAGIAAACLLADLIEGDKK